MSSHQVSTSHMTMPQTPMRGLTKEPAISSTNLYRAVEYSDRVLRFHGNHVQQMI